MTAPRPRSPHQRLRLGLILVVLVLAVVGGRLVQLQGLDASAYAAAAEQQRLRPTPLPAVRGALLDRHGEVLTRTVEARTIVADPQLVQDAETCSVTCVADQLAALLDIDRAELVERLHQDDRFASLARDLTPARAQEVMKLGLPGVFSRAEQRRVHPNGNLAGNVIGFTGRDGHGQAGLELGYDELLAGRDGREVREVDRYGRQIPQGRHSVREPIPGSSLRLTLDRDLQWMAQQTLAARVEATDAERGSVIVMDVRTGEVLAMATAPTVDPDNPGAVPAEDRGNAALQDVYEPGSVNKAVTAAAALEVGVVEPETVMTIPPGIRVADHVFTDSHEHGVLTMSFAGVIAASSNIGTIMVAQQLGRQTLYDFLTAFGYGSGTGLDFPGESAGLLAEPTEWSGTSGGTIPIGQGFSVTAMQMASVYQAIANGGVRVEPSLVAATLGPDGEAAANDRPAHRRVISTETADELSRILEAVTSDHGTAPAARIAGYRVAGKTGTAQRVDPDCSCYRGYSASFAGFAPADDPRFVVSVVVHDPRTSIYGGTVAAPVFQDVMTKTLERYDVAPTGSTPPPLRLGLD